MPFHNLGLLVGLFSPRCADLWPATRQEAVSCVYSLLYLQLGYEGEPLAGQRCGRDEEQAGPRWPGVLPSSTCSCSTGFSRDYRDDVAERLLTLKDGLVHPDPAILFHTCHSIAQVPASPPPEGRLPPRGDSQEPIASWAWQGAGLGAAQGSGLGAQEWERRFQ